jgi:hypothetical protein
VFGGSQAGNNTAAYANIDKLTTRDNIDDIAI